MDSINISALLFYAMMGAGYSPVNPPNGFSDGFQAIDNIDLSMSKNAIFEKRRNLAHPEREPL